MASPLSSEQEICPRCGGSGHVKRTRSVKPWSTWAARSDLAKKAQCGDRWIRIKSGRVVIIQAPVGSKHYGCIELLHETGQRTTKWLQYFAQEFTPETPPA